jgi:hypothetical protein
MLEANIKLTGVTYDELVYTLDEVRRKIEDTYRGGSDTREDDTGSYEFDITGEECDTVECNHCQAEVYITDENEKPEICTNCGEELS